MIQAFIDFGAFAGFFALWFGFLFWFISLAIQLAPDFFFSISMSQSEKWRRLNNALLQSKNSRLNRFGQLLIATGITLLMFVGAVWFGLQIKT